MTWTAYRFEPRDGPLAFHLGERGIGLEETSIVIHSDRLFSALCVAWRLLGEDLGKILAAFPTARFSPAYSDQPDPPPPFLISSAFPFYKNTYLFPKPLLPAGGISKNDAPVIGKGLKKIQYVSKEVFETWIAAQSLRDILLNQQQGQTTLRESAFLQGGKVLISDREAGQDLPAKGVLWSAAIQPRSTIGRYNNRSVVYGSGRVHFVTGAGLYFLVHFNQPEWQARLEEALDFLSEDGLGGERGIGNGRFRVVKDQSFQLKQPDEANGYLTLSMYWPAQQEVHSGQLQQAHYMLANQRGWITSPEGQGIRRPNLRMLAEGSVFKTRPLGRLVDLTPTWDDGKPGTAHPVWRYGFAFPVRCMLQEAD